MEDAGVSPASTDFLLAYDLQLHEEDWFIAWRSDEDTVAWGLRSDGTVYEDGAIVANIDATSTSFRVSVDASGHVLVTTLVGGIGAVLKELLVVPWYPPDGWPEAFTTSGQSWAHDPAPVIEAAGDFIEEPSVRVIGTVEAYQHAQGVRDGAWRPSLREVSLTLVEADERLYAPISVESTWDTLMSSIVPPNEDDLVVLVDARNIDGVFNETLTDGQEIDYIANLARYTGARSLNSFFEDMQFRPTGPAKAIYRAAGGLNDGPYIDVPASCWYDSPTLVSTLTQPGECHAIAYLPADARIIGGIDVNFRWLNYRSANLHTSYVPVTTLSGNALTVPRWHWLYTRLNGASSIIQDNDNGAIAGTVGTVGTNGWRFGARHDGIGNAAQRWQQLAVWRGPLGLSSLPGAAALHSYADARFGSGWPKV